MRTRSMVNKGGDESSCAALDEIRSCRVKSCYSWTVRQDGPCVLTDVQAQCGAGSQHRIIECLKWDGVSISLSSHLSLTNLACLEGNFIFFNFNFQVT